MAFELDNINDPYIMLRACVERRTYVKNYLIPSILAQGLSPQHILIWEDTQKEGNLTSFLKMMVWIYENSDRFPHIWLLQDDVLVSEKFVEKIRWFEENFDGIVCGYCCGAWNDEFLKKTGEQMNVFKWFSFPCERIPVRYVGEFLKWYEDAIHEEGMQGDKYRSWLKMNKLDDSFWTNYLLQCRPIEKCWNVGEFVDGKPTGGLVEHVDYLLGGSQINERTGDTRRLNYFWDEKDRTAALEMKILGKRYK